MKDVHVLVTGGAGYIGSILVPILLEQDVKVTVADNLMYRQTSLADCAYHRKFSFEKVDVRDHEAMRRLVSRADVVVPLAALVGAPICDLDPIGATSINRDSTLRLFESLSTDQRIVMPTTNSAYGSGAMGQVFTETSTLQPISLYAREKVEIEEALLNRPSSLSFRLATVFGVSPRMRLDLLVNDFARRAFFDRFIYLFEGHFKRNYVHVRDVGRILTAAVVHPEDFKHRIYNVGLTEANLTKFELCEVLREFFPDLVVVEGSGRRDPDQRNYMVANSRIDESGHGPKVSLREGLAELFKVMPMYANHQYSNV